MANAKHQDCCLDSLPEKQYKRRREQIWGREKDPQQGKGECSRRLLRAVDLEPCVEPHDQLVLGACLLLAQLLARTLKQAVPLRSTGVVFIAISLRARKPPNA